MSKKVMIYQPMFAPWPNFFLNINNVNTLIILDNVFRSKSDLLNRNFFWINQRKRMCTIPIKNRNQKKLINEIEIDYSHTQKIMNQINTSYSSTPYFKDLINILNPLIIQKHQYISTLNIEIIKNICSYLKIDTEIIVSSNLVRNEKEWLLKSPSEKNLYLTKEISYDHYISGVNGINYLDDDLFKKENIKVSYNLNNDKRELSILHYISIGGKEYYEEKNTII